MAYGNLCWIMLLLAFKISLYSCMWLKQQHNIQFLNCPMEQIQTIDGQIQEHQAVGSTVHSYRRATIHNLMLVLAQYSHGHLFVHFCVFYCFLRNCYKICAANLRNWKRHDWHIDLASLRPCDRYVPQFDGDWTFTAGVGFLESWVTASILVSNVFWDLQLQLTRNIVLRSSTLPLGLKSPT